eukprot:Awhi_evm1s15189
MVIRIMIIVLFTILQCCSATLVQIPQVEQVIYYPENVFALKNELTSFTIFPLNENQGNHIRLVAGSFNQQIAIVHENTTVAVGGNAINIYGQSVGQTTAKVNFLAKKDDELLASVSVLIKVTVILSFWAQYISFGFGWICFSLWAASFYPQIIENFKNKSVVGVNFDSVLYNLTGFSCYMIYNLGLYYSPYVQQQYMDSHPESSVAPVGFSDVAFTVHAVALTIIQLLQICIYERGDQKVTLSGWFGNGGVWVLAGVGAIISVTTNNILIFLQILSYVKLVLTLWKYLPQLWLNRVRRSTVGFSVGTQIFDITGAIVSIIQMFIDAVNCGDWSCFTGNFAKFGLAFMSVFFDALLIFQHYVLYPESKKVDTLYTQGSESSLSGLDYDTLEEAIDNYESSPLLIPKDKSSRAQSSSYDVFTV